MRRLYVIILFLLTFIKFGYSDTDSTSVIHSWKLTEDFDDTLHVKIDSFPDHFHIYNPIYKNTISSSFLGNVGLAHQSNILADFLELRKEFLLNPYSSYLQDNSTVRYFNTRKHFSNINYINRNKDENLVSIFHTQNITKYFNAGFRYNLISSKGDYINQATKNHSISFFTSYIKKRYSLHANVNYNKLNMNENGGIENDSIFEAGQASSLQIPVNLSTAKTQLRNANFSIIQKYNLGRKSEVMNEDSTFTTKFKNLATLQHSLEYSNTYRWYKDADLGNGFYSDTLFNILETNDSVVHHLLRNKFMVGLNAFKGIKSNIGVINDLERFHNYYHYYENQDSSYRSNGVFFNLKNNYDSVFYWNLRGEYFIDGYKQGNYKLNFALKRQISDSLSSFIYLLGNSCKRSPEYLENQYYSNHIVWDTTFQDKQETSLKLGYSKPSWNLDFGVNFMLLDNYIYFDQKAQPKQDNITQQVFSLYLNKTFNVGRFYFVNKLVYQKVNNDASSLRIPDISTYNSIYYQYYLVKNVLKSQIGFDVRYNSGYYGYAYHSASGQFYIQDVKKIGDYPYLSFFMNFKLKRARFFIIFEHLNADFQQNRYYTVVHNPMKGRIFRFGLSWNFYD